MFVGYATVRFHHQQSALGTLFRRLLRNQFFGQVKVKILSSHSFADRTLSAGSVLDSVFE